MQSLGAHHLCSAHRGTKWGCSACAYARELLKRGGMPSVRDAIVEWIADHDGVTWRGMVELRASLGDDAVRKRLVALRRCGRIFATKVHVPEGRRRPRQKSWHFSYSAQRNECEPDRRERTKELRATEGDELHEQPAPQPPGVS